MGKIIHSLDTFLRKFPRSLVVYTLGMAVGYSSPLQAYETEGLVTAREVQPHHQEMAPGALTLAGMDMLL